MGQASCLSAPIPHLATRQQRLLRQIDGTRSLGAIIDSLATQFDAPRALIAGDVTTMLRDLVDKGVLRW